ncbi:MAG: family 10 glycosylhydrolase, partial [Cellulosilyticaceae bacterium]
MKKILSILMMMCLMIGSMSTQVFAKTTNEDVRAVWISTVHNLDYPSVKNNEAAQKSEFIQKLDELQAIGINTVVVQVRPKGDALYQSSINPWSDVLTGTQGKYPGYDPMAFMIEEAHKRGMAFHAWLNPYRVTTAGTDVNVLSSDHPARLNPSWTISYKDALYYNPELPEVKAHIVDTVEEIVTNYDVDAIHFDDYFYPSNYPLPTGEGKDGDVANSRREHINEMIRQVSEVIKKVDQTVMFGISPMGIWKNDLSDITGSSTG